MKVMTAKELPELTTEMMASNPYLVTPKYLARDCGVSGVIVYADIRKGILQAYKHGERMFIVPSDADQYKLLFSAGIRGCRVKSNRKGEIA